MSALCNFAIDFVKLERLDGANFSGRQNKLYFLLTPLNVVHVLTIPKFEWTEDETSEIR